MKKYILFKTDKNVWAVPKEDWDRYIYNNEIVPICFTITDITQQGIEQLYEIFTSDMEQRIDIINEEIKMSNFTYYSN